MELKYESDVAIAKSGKAVVAHLHNIFSVVTDSAGIGTVEGADDLQQCGFSGSTGSDNRHYLTIDDVEIYAAKDLQRVVAFGYVAYFNHFLVITLMAWAASMHPNIAGIHATVP